ncbi:MAG: 6-phosphogluconolactonase [Opitutia bacterium]|nr:lactonase family protein [Opitutaceae bacterium]PHX85322.1 MAG: 6-phosphogluconolactonase [Opitutae bacterium]
MSLRLAPTLALLLTVLTPLAAAPKKFFVYFGTYTGAKTESQGIYRSRLDLATGRLSPAELAAPAKDPAFLALHPNGKFLYALDESSGPKRTPSTGLSAYAINPATGALTLLNQQTPGGPGPCHLAVDATGQTLLVANYSGGSVSAISLQPDGRLGALGSVVTHTGSSVNPGRQKAPHAHGIYFAPDNRFAFAPDLGIDRVVGYQLTPATAQLTLLKSGTGVPPVGSQSVRGAPPMSVTPGTHLPPGSGPRHLTFHPTGKFVYVINELLCTMTAFTYESAAGTLTSIQTISTLPPGEAIPKGTSTAEVQVHPNGKFLYGSNRGANTLVIYTIDEKTGQLTYLENVSTLGQTPRHFALDPTGTWLLTENQDSSTVAVFRVDPKSGRLTPNGPLVAVPAPVAAVFVPALPTR